MTGVSTPSTTNSASLSPAAAARPYTTVAPRVGGVIPDEGFGEPWTGGSNLHALPVPSYLTQRRPYKYSASQALLTKIEAGIPEKLGLSNKDCTCSFEHWMLLQSSAHVRFGLNTPFLMPNNTWTSETDLFACYSKSWSEVAPWIEQLKTGINHPLRGPFRTLCI